MKKLLVLGVGNILLMDEGIGVHAVHELLKEKDSWDETLIDFIDGGTFTQDIFYVFQDYEKVLVLDIVRAGNPAGSIYRLTEDALRKDKKQPLSLHDIDLLDSLSMAEIYGNRPTLDILGIEPEKIDWGTDMTFTLQDAFPRFLAEARKEISRLTA